MYTELAHVENLVLRILVENGDLQDEAPPEVRRQRLSYLRANLIEACREVVWAVDQVPAGSAGEQLFEQLADAKQGAIDLGETIQKLITSLQDK